MLTRVILWPARNWSLAILAGVLVFAVVKIYPTYLPILHWDGIGYHLWTYAILNGDLNFERYSEAYGYVGLYPTRDGSWWHNKYGPGVALIRLPVMVFFIGDQAASHGITRREGEAALVLAALALWATAYFMLRACRRIGVTGWAGHFAVLAGFFGTGLFFYGTSESGCSHVWSALGLSILLNVFLASGDKPERKRAGITLFAIALLLVLIRNTNLLAIVVIAVSFAIWRYRRGFTWKPIVVYPLLGSAIGLAIHVALNSNAHGRLVFSSYAEEEFLWDRPMHWSVLFAYQQGLLLYAPLFAVVVLAGLSLRETRPAAAAFGALTASLVFVYGFWHCWHLGGGVGHRGFVEIAPLTIPLLAGCLANAPRSVRRLLVAVSIAGVWVSLSFAVGCFRGTLPWHAQSRDTYVEHLVGGLGLLCF